MLDGKAKNRRAICAGIRNLLSPISSTSCDTPVCTRRPFCSCSKHSEKKESRLEKLAEARLSPKPCLRIRFKMEGPCPCPLHKDLEVLQRKLVTPGQPLVLVWEAEEPCREAGVSDQEHARNGRGQSSSPCRQQRDNVITHADLNAAGLMPVTPAKKEVLSKGRHVVRLLVRWAHHSHARDFWVSTSEPVALVPSQPVKARGDLHRSAFRRARGHAVDLLHVFWMFALKL